MASDLPGCPVRFRIPPILDRQELAGQNGHGTLKCPILGKNSFSHRDLCAKVLPVIAKVESSDLIEDLNGLSSKDSFPKLIFVLTKE